MDHTPRPPAREAEAPRITSAKVRTAAAAAIADDRDLPVLPPKRRQGPWVRRILVFVTCVLMLDALFGERGLGETMRARREFEQAEHTLGRMKQENAGLREQIRRLKDDPATIESVARAELGLIRPGEILVVVKDLK